MTVNATFIGQMIVFALLLWFFYKFVVPPIAQAITDRQKKIAEGLAAAERGQKDLDEAKSRADVVVREARERASAGHGAAAEVDVMALFRRMFGTAASVGQGMPGQGGMQAMPRGQAGAPMPAGEGSGGGGEFPEIAMPGGLPPITFAPMALPSSPVAMRVASRRSTPSARVRAASAASMPALSKSRSGLRAKALVGATWAL